MEFQYRKDPYAVAPDPQVERYPTAARRNSSITVAFTYTCPFDSTIPFDGTIQADAGSGIGSAFYLESGGSEEIHLVAGQSKTVTYVLADLPNYVGLTGLTFQFHYHWTYGDYTDGDIRMVIYLVHQNPNSPQEQPWIGVLDDACEWAAGDNTDDAVARDLTLGLYYSQRFYYYDNPQTGANWLRDGAFRLKGFLATTGYQAGNCVDVSDYLVICANALGLNFGIEQVKPSDGSAFHTNPLCPIGSDSTQSSLYSSYFWSFHQITTPLSSGSGGTDVYDSCAAQRYDLDGDPFYNPPFKWPLNTDYRNSYWQTDPELGLVATPHHIPVFQTDVFPVGISPAD